MYISWWDFLNKRLKQWPGLDGDSEAKMHLLSSVCLFKYLNVPQGEINAHNRSDLQKHSTLHAAKTWKNMVPICDKTPNYCCISEAFVLPWTFQLPHLPECSCDHQPPPQRQTQSWPRGDQQVGLQPSTQSLRDGDKNPFQVKKNNNEITGILYFVGVYLECEAFCVRDILDFAWVCSRVIFSH